ncbi:VOC family protein [Clostridium sp. SYSU_GA19001]|uniref:VOC family protein n=1 Tax=Clostridium caldaquaticum TaxID=2940653 RepID=UPI002077952D|nr:VOC family protein [Clostridium caldaquaticum]MCM8711258.1 VOC family protein [Clostridium caldaquaticum]
MGKIYKPLHVGISVYNMDEAIKWYEKNLDFKVIKDDYIPPIKARIVFIKNGDFEIELFQYDKPKSLPEDRLFPNIDLQTVGTKHVAFLTDDMKALKEKLIANGVDIAHEVIMEGNPVMFIRDNSGVLIEFIQK